MNVAERLADLKTKMEELKEDFRDFIADAEHFSLEERWNAYCDNQELLNFGPWVDHTYEEDLGEILALVREDYEAGNFCWHSDMYSDRYQTVKYEDVITHLEEDNWDYETEKSNPEATSLINELKEKLLQDACGGFTFDW